MRPNDTFHGDPAKSSRLSDEVDRLIGGLTLDEQTKVKIVEFRRSNPVSDQQWRDVCVVLYRKKLLECLEDHRLTEEEEQYLQDLALTFELPNEESRRVRLQLADVAMKQFARTVLEDQILTDDERKDFFRLGRFLEFPVEQIRDYLTGESLRYYTEFWDTSSSKKMLDSSKHGQLQEFQQNLRIKVESDQPTERDYAKLKLLWMIKNGLLPGTPYGIFEEYDEVCHWLQKSARYEEDAEGSFSSCAPTQGVPVSSERVYIVGSSKEHTFDCSRLRPKAQGEFAITSYRVLHRIQGQSLDLPFEAFVDVRIFLQGIEIQCDGSAGRKFFELEDVDLAASVLSVALQRMHDRLSVF